MDVLGFADEVEIGNDVIIVCIGLLLEIGEELCKFGISTGAVGEEIFEREVLGVIDGECKIGVETTFD